jgi:hypothetical protein
MTDPGKDSEEDRTIKIDPAVANLLDEGRQRQEERSMSPSERRKLAKQRAKESKRNRKILDLPEELTDRLKQLAEKYGCPESQVAAFLLAKGFQDIDSQALDLFPHLRPSRSPRYKNNLEIPEIQEEEAEES